MKSTVLHHLIPFQKLEHLLFLMDTYYYTATQLKNWQKKKVFCNSKYWLGIKDIVTFSFSFLALMISIFAYYKDSPGLSVKGKGDLLNQSSKTIKDSHSIIDTAIIKEKQSMAKNKVNLADTTKVKK